MRIFFILIIFFFSSCATVNTGLHEVKWNDCDRDHVGTPLAFYLNRSFYGIEVILSEDSRYTVPYCNCEDSDRGDWVKLGGGSSKINAQEMSVLLAWRYVDGKHYLAPYIHDTYKGDEINPDFCQADKIIEANEGQKYFFIMRSVGGTVDYALISKNELLFYDTLPPDKDFPGCRQARFGGWSTLRAVQAYFGGQCRPPETTFKRRIIPPVEVENMFPYVN